MNIIEKSLSVLEKYLSETNPEVIEKYIQEVASLQIPGPLVTEYFTQYETEFIYTDWIEGITSNGTIQKTFNSNEISDIFCVTSQGEEIGLLMSETIFITSNLSDSFRNLPSDRNIAA